MLLCSCALVLFLQNKANLPVGQNGANSYMKEFYGNKPPCGAEKNKANLQNSRCNFGVIAKFALSGFDFVNVDGIGRAGGTYWLAGHKNYPVAGLCPVVIQNELINQRREPADILRNWLAAWYDAVMQAHLPA